MELGRASGSGSKKGFKPGLDIRVYDDDDLDRLEQVSQFQQFWVFELSHLVGKPSISLPSALACEGPDFLLSHSISDKGSAPKEVENVNAAPLGPALE